MFEKKYHGEIWAPLEDRTSDPLTGVPVFSNDYYTGCESTCYDSNQTNNDLIMTVLNPYSTYSRDHNLVYSVQMCFSLSVTEAL